MARGANCSRVVEAWRCGRTMVVSSPDAAHGRPAAQWVGEAADNSRLERAGLMPDVAL